MRFLSTLLALPVAGVWAAAPILPEVVRENVIPNNYIIEVSKANLDAVAKGIAANGGKILKTFKSDIFSGFSVESSSHNVDSLQQIAQIRKAWSVGRIQLAPLQPLASFGDDLSAPNFSAHHLTGVQQVHEAGIFGKGVTVAIVDTGTAYDHPALGGGFGPEYKVIGGWDFTGESDWPYGEPKEPDADPYDYIGHGTHVAGIVAGKSDWYIGVAPEVNILSYKVFTQTGVTDDVTLIDAFLAAYDAGADIITSSIGGLSGWSTDPWAEVASRLVDLGVVVTISAGNSGFNGPFFASSGSSGTNVLAIGSIDQAVKVAEPFSATFTVDGVSNTTDGIAYLPLFYTWDGLELEIVPISLDTADEAQACSPLAASPSTPDLTGKIALIRRGGCEFTTKQVNAAALGAEWVMIYNTPGGALVAPSSSYSYNVAMVEQKVGEAIVATYAAGGSVSAHFAAEDGWKVGVFNSAGGIPSDFSSWGGTYDLAIKPDIGAPGREIYSTYLDGGWATLSGTSMACPYAAGVAALYISKFGGRSVHGPGFAKVLADKILSSGASVQWQVSHAPDAPPTDYGYWAPTIQIGTGMINAWKVLSYETELTFDKIALNDTRHFSRYHDVYIKNTGAKPVTYTFSLQPAGGLELQSREWPWLKYVEEIQPITIVPNVTFPSGVFTVKPGETKKAQFNFKPIQGVDPTWYPVYSGKILISGSNKEELSVPYLGAAFDVKDATRGDMFIFDTPFQYSGPIYEDIDVYNKYTFNATTQSFPKFLWELHWGSKEVRWDIFESGWRESRWSYPPVVGANGYVGSATTYFDTFGIDTFDPATMNRDDTIPFPLYDLYRTSSYSITSHSAWWMGKLDNGSIIQPGKYTIRFAALSPFGDPEHSDNWHVWKTPEITVLPLEI